MNKLAVTCHLLMSSLSVSISNEDFKDYPVWIVEPIDWLMSVTLKLIKLGRPGKILESCPVRFGVQVPERGPANSCTGMIEERKETRN